MLAFPLRIAAAMFVSAGLVTVPAYAASTAKEAVKDATAAAQKWQPDAVLTHVSTLTARGDGTADQWLYTYYAPKAKKSAIVTAKGKKIEVEADVRNTSVDPLGTDFLDSDKAAEAAAKAGLKFGKADKGLGLGLTVGNQAVGKPQRFWSVMVYSDAAISSVTLNAADGALIKRDDIKLK